MSPVDGIGYQDELIKVPVGEDGGESAQRIEDPLRLIQGSSTD